MPECLPDRKLRGHACRASMFLSFLDSRQKNAGMTDGALDSRQKIAGMTEGALDSGFHRNDE